MKKSGLLAIPLLAVSFLASCNQPNPTPIEDVEFSATTTVVLDETKKIANIALNWTPTDHSIECSDFTFTLIDQIDITSTIESGELGSRPLNLTVTFDKALETDDKGVLKFHYNDKTAQKEGEGKVSGINVELPVDPPGPGPTKYTLEVNCTDCAPSGNQSSYEAETPVLFTITPKDDFVLPKKEDIIVDGVTSFEYTISSGVATFSCSMPAKKVTVTVAATPVYLNYLKANMRIVIPETNEDLTFGFTHNGTKKITVDWGDEVVNNDTSHPYNESGAYDISIYGEDITSIDAGFTVSHASRAYLTQIQLQEGITTINDFINCTNLTSISIPSSITSIKNDAFTNCNNLVYETYDKCKYLGNDNNKYQVVMGPCEKTITTTSLHENCTVIKDAAFNVSQLASIVIPNGILSIPMNTFHGTKLTSVTIPNSVTSIGEFAFDSCGELKSVYIDISSNLENIEMCAFHSCTALETVVIPPSVKNIDKAAFGNVTSLKEVDLTGFDVQEYEDLPLLSNPVFTNYPDSVVFYVKDNRMAGIFANDIEHGWSIIDGSLYKPKPSVNNL